MGGGDKQQLDARKDVMMKKEKMTAPRRRGPHLKRSEKLIPTYVDKRHQDGTTQFCAAESAEKDLLL